MVKPYDAWREHLVGRPRFDPGLITVVWAGDTAVAFAYEELAMLGNLTALRPNKPVADDGIDPAVAAAIAGKKEPEGPPPAATDNKKAGAKQKK